MSLKVNHSESNPTLHIKLANRPISNDGGSAIIQYLTLLVQGYGQDKTHDAKHDDPIDTMFLGHELASQPTISRALDQLGSIDYRT